MKGIMSIDNQKKATKHTEQILFSNVVMQHK